MGCVYLILPKSDCELLRSIICYITMERKVSKRPHLERDNGRKVLLRDVDLEREIIHRRQGTIEDA